MHTLKVPAVVFPYINNNFISSYLPRLLVGCEKVIAERQAS